MCDTVFKDVMAIRVLKCDAIQDEIECEVMLSDMVDYEMMRRGAM